MAINTNIRKVILIRTYSAFGGMLVFACFIIWYLIKIDFIERKKWLNMADSLSTKVFDVAPVRGNIFDCNGNLLATSMPIYDIIIDAVAAKDEEFETGIDSLSMGLSNIFKDKSKDSYKKLITNLRQRKERYHVLHKKASFKQMRRVQQLPILRLGKYKGGLIVENKNRREKPFDYLAERTIGFTQENVAKVGIEGAYDKYLAGTSGKKAMQRIAGGTWISLNEDDEIEAQHGNDIITSIDINLQDVATHSLMNVLKLNDAEWGTAILMEVQTGEIKAIANLSRVSEGEYKERFNYAVGECLEPGSTFKLASVMSLLDDGVIDNNDLFDTEDGSHQYCPNATIHESEGKGSGLINIQTAFEKSSNVAISKAVFNNYRGKPELFYNHLEKLHLTKKLGLQIQGEGVPLIKHPSDRAWSCTTLPWSSIGYEVLVTPLHIATLYNSVANNGKMVKPLFVKKIVNNGNTVKEYHTEVLVEKVCNNETLTYLRKMLEGVVIRGTGSKLRSPYYTAAGKTGTALVADRKHGYKKKIYRSSFCAYFPAENPKYTCFVMVNAPSKGVFYGAAVAGPVFKDLADKVYANSIQLHKELKFTHNHFSNDLPSIQVANTEDIKQVLDKVSISSHMHNHSINEFETDWMQAEMQDNSLAIQPVKTLKSIMPNLQGMKAKDAVYMLEKSGAKVLVEGFGKVKKQSVKAGERINRGITIKLQLS